MERETSHFSPVLLRLAIEFLQGGVKVSKKCVELIRFRCLFYFYFYFLWLS